MKRALVALSLLVLTACGTATGATPAAAPLTPCPTGTSTTQKLANLDCRVKRLESPTPTPTPTPTPSPTPTVTPTVSPTVTATATTTPPPPPLTLAAPEGGLGYYGQFTNPLPTTTAFFPIAVWGAYNQTQANLDLDAAAGINTYVWASDSGYLPAIRADGRFHVIQDASQRTNVGTETKGWLLGDEDDMTAPDGACPGNLTGRKVNDGRMSMENFGKGLALPPGDGPDNPEAQHNWWANTAEANCYANAVNLASVDMYWFTDPYNTGQRYGYLYGDNIRNLRRAALSDGQAQPLWGFVETGWPWGSTEGATNAIRPDELRSAAWHTIIAGARGLMWFEHSFGGPNAGDHHTIRTNSEGTRPMVTSVDAQLKALAPVLNSSTVTNSYTKTGDVEAMVKWDGTNFYVFAGARRGATSMTFSLPCVGTATATRLGEAGSVAFAGGSFTDAFADKNAVHIYRIDGGSRCGL